MATLPRRPLAVAVALAALALAGCAGSSAPVPTIAAPSTPPAGSDPSPSATPTVDAVEITCESLVTPDTLDELTAQGWEVKEEPFVVDDITLAAGMQCTWGDFSTANGNLLLFGWAPVTDDEADAMQDALTADGWRTEEDPEGLVVTAPEGEGLTFDDEGYGQTYRFGDGWVTVADTKQNLLLIQRPAS